MFIQLNSRFMDSGPSLLWIAKINAEKSSPYQLWRSIDALMGRGSARECDTIDAPQFHDYFDTKGARVRSATDCTPKLSYTQPFSEFHQMTFTPVSIDAITVAVRALPD